MKYCDDIKTIMRKLSILVFLLVVQFPVLAGAAGESGNDSGLNKLLLPDSGQSKSYTDVFGEDSNYDINPLSFIDNGDETVTDNVTNIMWQKNGDTVPKTWEDAVRYCDKLELAGHSDWRLPNSLELMTIVDSSSYRPSINKKYFPNTFPSEYWTSTVDVSYPSLAWNVSFNYGELFHFNKSSSYYVRCARGPREITRSFTDNGNGTVTDNLTGLMWQRRDNIPIAGMKWEAALNYCENLSHGGHDDWRVPNYKELVSIIDYKKVNPALDTKYFPDIIPKSYSGYYWSSTTLVSNDYHAWLVHFAFGQVIYCSKETNFLVRCVRGGK